MKKNDLFETEITDMSVNGEGIGHACGMTFFIKDAVIGDVITARVTKLKKNYGYARVEEIRQASAHRIDPPCPIAKRCGGCQIQALSYDEQLRFKTEKVRDNLIRIGGFSQEKIDAVMEPPVGMKEPYRYRNKAQFPVGADKEGNIVTGFYAAHSHNIVPVEDCLLGVKENAKILRTVKTWMQQYRILPYDEDTAKGLVRHILIRYGFTTKEIMVCVVINGKALPHGQELARALSQIKGMTSVTYNCNCKKTNVILGDETYPVWGQEYIKDHIHLRNTDEEFTVTDTAIAYHISPQSFYQVNPLQTEKLYSTALAYAGLTGRETVWDLYCGIGTISLFLSQRAKQVYGVEVIPQAIEDARDNARLNGIGNAEFFVGKAEDVLTELYRDPQKAPNAPNGTADAKADIKRKEMLAPDVIVVDPPRKGCDEKCLSTMLAMHPERIVYVSCDPATLARDLRILCDGGYELKRVRVFDQFGHSVHVETVILLSQQKPDDVIEVELELDELDLTSAESKATYAEIKDYVFKEHGLKVSSLYISQVKKKCGIEVGENYNLPKSEDSRQPQCPEEKEKAIKDALEHFGMV